MLQLQVWQGFFHHYPWFFFFSIFASSCSYHAILLVISFFHLISSFCLDSIPIILRVDQFFIQIFSLKKYKTRLIQIFFAEVWLLKFYLLKEIVARILEWVSDDNWILIWTCDEHGLCSCMYLFVVISYQDLAVLSWWEELGPCAKCCNSVTSGVTGVVRNNLQFSQHGELSLDPLVTRTVGLYVRALVCAGLPAALLLESPSGSCPTVSSLAVHSLSCPPDEQSQCFLLRLQASYQ